MSDYDIAIVGGGLVGASLAVALDPVARASGWRVALIESGSPPATQPVWDERCIAVNDASFRIFTALGIWPLLADQAEPIRATHISERGRFGVARFDAAEAGLDALGYNVPLRAIGGAVWTRMRQTGVALRCPAKVADLTADEGGVQLQLEEAAADALISARLVAAADGARSVVRQRLGLSAQVRDYGQHAIVSAVRIGRPHHGVAYERFTPDGPIAVLPKARDACSLVWTVPSARVEALLALPDGAYIAAAQDAFGGRLGRFLALGKRVAHPLARVLAAQASATRTLFLGNASQSLHPVAAQGFNLGLRDVAGLAEVLAAVPDPGAPEVLAIYAARRAADRERVSGFTDRLVRTFSNRVPGLAQARHWGLLGLELAPPLRRQVLHQHLGHLGLPAGL